MNSPNSQNHILGDTQFINMVYISETIINQVKGAKSEEEIRAIIDKCISGLKIKHENGRIDKKYTRNILVTLKYYKAKESEPGTLSNINVAIEIAKKMHAQGTEGLW